MADPVTPGTIGMAASGASRAAGILVRYLVGLPKLMLINISRRWHGKMQRSPSKTRNTRSILANSRLKRLASPVRRKAGQIKAAQGASGVDVNSGSAKEVQTSQHLVSQMDLNTIREKAAKTAYDFSVQATNYENQAKGYSKAASNARTEGISGRGVLVHRHGWIGFKQMDSRQPTWYVGQGGSNLSNPGPDPLTEWEYGR